MIMTIIANGYVECYTLSAEICKKILDPNLLDYFRKKYHFNDFSIELKDLEFIKELGKGSYGQVNLVKSIKNKQYYAIKSLDINQITLFNHVITSLQTKNFRKNSNDQKHLKYIQNYKV